jgi:adenine-specific DNA-methyltransferase
MYPRLFLAKNLLCEDGIIFISIDDAEVNNLKSICNEIFGEENFVGCIVRTTGQTTGQDSEGLGSSFDYILCYSKSPDRGLNGLSLTEHDLKRFENEDKRGKYAIDQMRKTGSGDKREDRPNMFYSVKDPDGNDVFPIAPLGYEGRWRVEKKRYNELVREDYILWKKVRRGSEEIWWPFIKYYLEGRTKRPSPLWDDLEGNKKAARDLRAIFDGKKIFDYPKPVELIKRIVSISTNEKSDIVMDIFSGSATTAHGIIEYNIENNTNIKFICVQLPELIEENSEAFKEGYESISDIGKERIRRVIKNTSVEINKNKKITEGAPKLFIDETKEQKQQFDLGFKVLKLTKSNFSRWDTGVDKNPEAIQEQLFKHVQHISPEAEQEAILYELLLKSGFELTTPIKKLELENKQVFSIGENELLICLEKQLTHEVIKAMAELKPIRVLCLDEGFQNNDQLKTNAALIMKTNGVVKFQTV